MQSRDNKNKFNGRGYSWQPKRGWLRRYLRDLKKVFGPAATKQ